MDFLDEIATPTQTEQTSAQADNEPTDNTQNASNEPQTDAATEPENTDSTDSGSKYSNVVETREADADVSDLHTVADFANQLTVTNITQKNMGADGVVDKSAVYAAMRAVRHPLPVVMVGSQAYLPDSAFKAWDERPARGEGGAGSSGGKLSDEDLLRLSATARDTKDALTKRLESLQGRLNKATGLLAKRDRQLAERFGQGAWDKVDEWVSAHETEIADDTKEPATASA